MVEDEGLLLDIGEEEFELAGSKFITFPPAPKAGDIQCRKVEIGTDAGWDTVGSSVKLPVIVIEKGPDKNKQDKLSFGIKKDAIWKGKEACAALIDASTGKVGVPLENVFQTVETGDGRKVKKFMPMAVIGKQTYGIWAIQKGLKGGVAIEEGGEETLYPKLVSFSAEPVKTESLGI